MDVRWSNAPLQVLTINVGIPTASVGAAAFRLLWNGGDFSIFTF